MLLTETACASSQSTPVNTPTRAVTPINFAATYQAASASPTPTPVNAPPIDPSKLQEQANCTTVNCWDGITPGLTTFTAAQVILAERYGAENVTTSQRHMSVEWETDLPDNSQGGWLVSDEEGIVQQIFIRFYETQLTVERLVDWLGEPSRVDIVRAFSDTTLCAGASLLYQDASVYASLLPDHNSSVGISPTQSVGGLQFLTLDDAANFNITDTFFLEWVGYADYCHLVSLTPPPPWMRITPFPTTTGSPP